MSSIFEKVPLLPADTIFGITQDFNADPRRQKVNLGVGTYKDAEGRPLVLHSVFQAEELLLEQKPDKEYLPIGGDSEFVSLLLKVVFGEHRALQEKRIQGIQSLGGTGALRIGGEFLLRQMRSSNLYLSDPTWPNHNNVFGMTGFAIETYPYYDDQAKKVNFSGMLNALEKAPEGSVFLFQACCHNPTGFDLTLEQWREVSDLLKKRNLFPFFDFAYQGFGDGFDEDAKVVRFFVDQGHEFFLAYSCSKNFGLYGERTGLLAVVARDFEAANSVTSHLRAMARASYSNPPLHGMRLVKTILNSPSLRQEWVNEMRAVVDRIAEMRRALAAALQSGQNRRDFSFLLNQKGMFSFCGLKQDEVTTLRQEYAIYMPGNGRINVAGLNLKNLEYVVNAIQSLP